jgi:glutathione reductase (NADPH)
VPKKLFVYASRFSDTFDKAVEFGWRSSVPHFDWLSLVAAKDREIARLAGPYGTGQESAGVEVVSPGPYLRTPTRCASSTTVDVCVRARS